MPSQGAVDGKVIQPLGMIGSGFYKAHQALDLLYCLGIKLMLDHTSVLISDLLRSEILGEPN